jgi:pSer/pThr/pTyr-binding forkhead associated (FHA) protein
MPRCRLSEPGASAWLEFINGPMGGRSIELRVPQISIGSVASNDVVLSDPAVSESHVVIVCPGDRFILKDQGSTNGVYVNGVRVKNYVLAGGDQLRIGNIDATLRLR